MNSASAADAACFNDEMTARYVKLFLYLLALVMSATTVPVRAEIATVVRSVEPSPRVLTAGSPCLFTVRLSAAASSVTGEWMHQKLVFSPMPATANSWYALAGVDVEAKAGPQQLSLQIALPAGALAFSRTIDVQPSTYKTLALHVPAKFVSPDAETLARIAIEKPIKEAAFAHSLDQIAWRGDFIAPVHAATTETFGTRRVFNGETASIHRGLDFRAGFGTPIEAANSGVVVLAQQLFYEGGFVVIDHGEHFMTLYMHLSKIGVVVGESVRKGQRIGLSGASGRVTGPHLHFAVRWQEAYLDPEKLLKLQLPDAGSR